MSKPDLLYEIALSLINSVGPITAKLIVSHCGSAKAVFQAQRRTLMKIPGIGPKTVNEILNPGVLKLAEKELEQVQKNDIKVYYYLDQNYPGRLKNLDDSPVILYVQGQDVLNYPRNVGIVGTRKPSERARILCQQIVEGLKAYNPLIISGLAYGVDGIAHRAACDAGMANLGVMGNGLSITYPAMHRGLRNRMVDQGAVMTEFPFKKGPEREHFPMRNRIIAGMSDALIVIESAKKGGSMITAQFAFAYNKDVFAIPGRPSDALAAGPNYLIKTNVASLVEKAEDIALKMMWEKKPVDKRAAQLELFTQLTEPQERVVQILKDADVKTPSIDYIVYESKMSPGVLSGLLLELELKNVIKALPGSKYTLLS